MPHFHDFIDVLSHIPQMVYYAATTYKVYVELSQRSSTDSKKD